MSVELQRLLDELERARDPLAEARGRERIGAVYAGREADRLPILVDTPAHDVVQADLREQFYSAETMLIAHLKRLIAAAALGADGQLCIRPNLGVVLVPSVFGLAPEVPREAMPRFREHLSKAQVMRLDAPDIERAELVQRALEYARYFLQVLGDRAHVYVPDTQGVFDIAHLVMGDALFVELYDDPPFVHHLLELCLQAYLDVTWAFKRALGEPAESGYHGHGMVSGLYLSRGGARVSEDTPTLLRPPHIDEYVMPYVTRALQPFGGGFVHYCGHNEYLLRALLDNELVRGINLGNPEQHDPAHTMDTIRAADKFYFGFWPRLAGEALPDYVRRMLALTYGERKGFIFLLTPQELGNDRAQEAISLWRELQC